MTRTTKYIYFFASVAVFILIAWLVKTELRIAQVRKQKTQLLALIESDSAYKSLKVRTVGRFRQNVLQGTFASPEIKQTFEMKLSQINSDGLVIDLGVDLIQAEQKPLDRK